MKVKELIEQLKECDADSDVYTLFEHDNPFEDEGFQLTECFQSAVRQLKKCTHSYTPTVE